VADRAVYFAKITRSAQTGAFDRTYELVNEGCRALLDDICEHEGLTHAT